MMPEINIFVLLYGAYRTLHERLLDGFVDFVPQDVPIYFWYNVPSDATIQLIERHRRPNWTVRLSQENVPKYQAMREMFCDLRASGSPGRFALWFDDDTRIVRRDWYQRTEGLLHGPNLQYFGAPWTLRLEPHMQDFVKTSPHYQGKVFLEDRGKIVAQYAAGHYFGLRADVIQKFDWPDQRIRHFTGDLYLGEILRQNGILLWPFCYGIELNTAQRRGYGADRVLANDIESD